MLCKVCGQENCSDQEHMRTTESDQGQPEPETEGQIVSNAGAIVSQIVEADKSGKEVEFLMVEKGSSKNGFFWPEDRLRESATLFEKADAFADHTNDNELATRPERSVKDKIGRWHNVHYGTATIEGQIKEGLIGTLKVVAPWMRDLIRESVEMGELDFLGVSIDAFAKHSPKVMGGRRIQEVTKVLKVNSVDVVTRPSAGGRLTRLVASDRSGLGGNTQERSSLLKCTVCGIENCPGHEGAGAAGSGGAATAVREGVIQLTPAQLAELVRNQVAEVMREASQPIQESLRAQQEEMTQLREADRRRTQQARIDAAISAAEGLSERGQSRLRESFYDTITRRDLTDEEVLSAIRESVAYEAALVQERLPGPLAQPRVHVGSSEGDKMYLAIQGMFANEALKDKDGREVPPFRSIRESYCKWSGRDYFDTDPLEVWDALNVKYDSARDHKRIQESVSTATWGQVYADVLYLMLIKAYRVNPVYNAWRQVVSDVENVPDFQQRHWTRLGGYNDLVTVPEAGTYQPMTSSTNEGLAYAVSKRGGLDDVTFEAITNDRVGAVRRIPTAMARAAARTLFKFVMDTITRNNPVMSYDSVALYNSAHGNGIDANTLSLTGLQLGTAKMRLQTAFSESQEILGERNKPKTLIVPTQLEFIAQRLTNPSDAYLAAIANPSTEQSLDPQAFKNQLTYIVYDVLTSQTAWWLVADPGEVATMVMGFLNGKEDPELFVQDQPNVGSNFTADKVTYKIRHIYGGVVEDHRSFYQGNS